MKLFQAIANLHALDPESTIYAAEPWTEDSECIVAHEPHGEGLPVEAESRRLKYFLRVWTANDFCNAWAATQQFEPTLMQKCARLIQYAKTNA